MINVWYRAYVVDVGWSNWRVEKIEKNESFYGRCKAMGYNNQQIVEIYEAIERRTNAIKELMEAVAKAMSPVIEPITKLGLDIFEFYSPPEKNKIYQSEYRMKSNVKNYGYKQNYRKRMFCVGGYGNFRRF